MGSQPPRSFLYIRSHFVFGVLQIIVGFAALLLRERLVFACSARAVHFPFPHLAEEKTSASQLGKISDGWHPGAVGGLADPGRILACQIGGLEPREKRFLLGPYFVLPFHPSGRGHDLAWLQDNAIDCFSLGVPV